MRNKTRDYIKKEVEKLRQLKAKTAEKMTIARLKRMKGFEHLPDEVAKEVLELLEEYAQIILLYLNSMKSKKDTNDEF